ncbi:tyrosine-type recombinase/integrase [Sporolactobacillus kofuensis]|uniref:Tyrosine-type recombinase/integrase n=1 Tax=Sporolactobacillus kofuensis TaxID=269672 RepID=A0ABW1WGE7_9BACL|nr:tyrosine-type recombinase/integrase [Sporolactobacillus kofuensis]MCO7176646.1 tyrosine-type recombinase/integrase [Sporolactobacillus kofuensis]
MKKQLDDFLAVLIKDRGLSKNTIEAYRNDLHQYLDYLIYQEHCTAWENVTDLVVIKYLYYLKDRGNATTTQARKAAAVRGFHRYLLRNHQMTHDPAYTLEIPNVEPRTLSTLLTIDQVNKLLKAPDSSTKLGRRDRAMLELLYATGMRVSECIQLNREHVNLELEFVQCVGGKKGSERIIPLNPPAIEALDQYMNMDHESAEEEKAEQPLFINRLNRRLTRQGVWKILKHNAEIAGLAISLSPETLRQSLTAHLLQNGASLEFIDELLGRSPSSTVLRYSLPKRPPLKKLYASFHPRVKE